MSYCDGLKTINNTTLHTKQLRPSRLRLVVRTPPPPDCAWVWRSVALPSSRVRPSAVVVSRLSVRPFLRPSRRLSRPRRPSSFRPSRRVRPVVAFSVLCLSVPSSVPSSSFVPCLSAPSSVPSSLSVLCPSAPPSVLVRSSAQRVVFALFFCSPPGCARYFLLSRSTYNKEEVPNRWPVVGGYDDARFAIGSLPLRLSATSCGLSSLALASSPSGRHFRFCAAWSLCVPPWLTPPQCPCPIHPNIQISKYIYRERERYIYIYIYIYCQLLNAIRTYKPPMVISWGGCG